MVCCLVLHGVYVNAERNGVILYGMVWYGMVWYGMVWYGMVWYGMVWYGMVCMVMQMVWSVW
jgi:chloride channel 2